MYTRAICGYNGLDYPQWEDGYPTYTVCECCGFESVFDDDNMEMTLEEYRDRWIKTGTEWFSKEKKPLNWSLENQLKNINIELK